MRRNDYEKKSKCMRNEKKNPVKNEFENENGFTDDSNAIIEFFKKC